jgi:hypothetical protein
MLVQKVESAINQRLVQAAGQATEMAAICKDGEVNVCSEKT